jgi:asparagine N-glycosylation enzyme membrane subunit Stt3
VAVVTAASALPGLRALPGPHPRLEALARAAAPLADPALPRGAVLARWDAGHHLRYASGRPVIASPFGTEGGEGALEDAASFFLAEDPAEAAALLARRGVRFVVLDDPANAVLEAVAVAGSPRPPVVKVGDAQGGSSIHCEPWYDRLVAARLYFSTGQSTLQDPVALGGFRLVSDAGDPSAPVRVFEVVPGAAVAVRGARPGARVEARTEITTALGAFRWTARATADLLGRAELRLPFSTGRNGQVLASPYAVADGATTVLLRLGEDEVRRGSPVEIALGPAVPAAGRAR